MNLITFTCSNKTTLSRVDFVSIISINVIRNYGTVYNNVSDKNQLLIDYYSALKHNETNLRKYFPTKLLNQDVTPTDSAWNLGVEFDKDFNFKKHIKSLSIMLLSYTWFASLAQMFNSGSD